MDDQLKQYLFLQVLELSGKARTDAYFVRIAGTGKKAARQTLHTLKAKGLVALQAAGGWELRAEASHVRLARRELRGRAAPGSVDHHLGFLEEKLWVGHIDHWLAFLDEQLKLGDQAASACLELTVLFFLHLGGKLVLQPDLEQGRKFLETVILIQALCFSNKQYTDEAMRLSSLYYEINLSCCSDGFPMYMDMIKRFTDFSLSKGSISSDLAQSLAPLARAGAEADYPALLEENPYVATFRQIFSIMEEKSSSGTAEVQLFNVIATGLSHIAMHMRNFSISEHIYNSLLNLRENKEENAISLIWLSHYCFVLLRQGKLDEALERINLLFNCLDTKKDPLSFASAARALALYHFFHGRVREAHTVLTRQTCFAMEHGIARSAFLDPMNFDMLYVFEQRGYAPVPRYELDSTIADVLSQSSQLMQGAALRIAALRLRAKGGPPTEVIRLLQASKDKLHPERDVRELILTLHEMANTLILAGDYDGAGQCRKIIAAHAGREISPDMPYLELAFLATLVPNIQPGQSPAEPVELAQSGSSALPVDEEAGAVEAGVASCPLLAQMPPGREHDGAHFVIGEGMQAVLRKAGSVAASFAAVLIQGETGVGKELVARHIHDCSGRSGAFVAVHPASTSETLFESEFFGHERGAFTGAAYARKGFFEEAHQGTLFMDEIGEVPPLLQTKFLRVLQEKRFMRVGSSRLLESNFRLVAATNRDMRREVEQGRFRAELLFRIAVIPIFIPPLRERQQDIIPLVEAYMEYFCHCYDRAPVTLAQRDMALLQRYAWPGNVRELKNTLERIVLQGRFEPEFLQYGETISFPGLQAMYERLPRFEELEKQYLQYVLAHTAGKVRGPEGAAALLSMKTSTLYAKMKRMGLNL